MSCAGYPWSIGIDTISESRGDTTVTTTDWTTDTKGVGQYADVNGIHLYYETHGTGGPLILLHGGLGSGRCSPRSCRRSQRSIG